MSVEATNRRGWRSLPVYLVASHALVMLVAWAAGSFYYGATRGSVQTIIDSVARQPLGHAASLAFRFGSAEHARVLLTHVPPVSADGAVASADLMLTELRLAVLEGEHLSDAKEAQHLTAAANACERFQPNCELKQLRAMATKIAEQRAPSP